MSVSPCGCSSRRPDAPWGCESGSDPAVKRCRIACHPDATLITSLFTPSGSWHPNWKDPDLSHLNMLTHNYMKYIEICWSDVKLGKKHVHRVSKWKSTSARPSSHPGDTKRILQSTPSPVPASIAGSSVVTTQTSLNQESSFIIIQYGSPVEQSNQIEEFEPTESKTLPRRMDINKSSTAASFCIATTWNLGLRHHWPRKNGHLGNSMLLQLSLSWPAPVSQPVPHPLALRRLQVFLAEWPIRCSGSNSPACSIRNCQNLSLHQDQGGIFLQVHQDQYCKSAISDLHLRDSRLLPHLDAVPAPNEWRLAPTHHFLSSSRPAGVPGEKTLWISGCRAQCGVCLAFSLAATSAANECKCTVSIQRLRVRSSMKTLD